MKAAKYRKGRSADLRKGRYSEAGRAYFVTKCVLKRDQRPLARSDCARQVIDSFMWARDRGWFQILGFVIMPDHYHLVLGLGEVLPLDAMMRRLNSYLAHEITRMLGSPGNFRQRGFYEHAIRDRQDFDVILAYVHRNRVEAGLVEEPENWPWSTAHPTWAHLIDWEWLGPSLPHYVRARHRFEPGGLPFPYR